MRREALPLLLLVLGASLIGVGVAPVFVPAPPASSDEPSYSVCYFFENASPSCWAVYTYTCPDNVSACYRYVPLNMSA